MCCLKLSDWHQRQIDMLSASLPFFSIFAIKNCVVTKVASDKLAFLSVASILFYSQHSLCSAAVVDFEHKTHWWEMWEMCSFFLLPVFINSHPRSNKKRRKRKLLVVALAVDCTMCCSKVSIASHRGCGPIGNSKSKSAADHFQPNSKVS